MIIMSKKKKHNKVGDIVELDGVRLRIEANRGGDCSGCYYCNQSKFRCLKACYHFGDCFDFSEDEQYVKFVEVKE